MRRSTMAMTVLAALAARAVPMTIRLTPDKVVVRAGPDEVLAQFRGHLVENSDTIVAAERCVVARFRGRAGWFRYRTVELVTFESEAVTFEHLRGPFASCHERFQLAPTPTGTRVTHTGTFALRGGLWSWPFGVSVVKPVFEAHVRAHLQQMDHGMHLLIGP